MNLRTISLLLLCHLLLFAIPPYSGLAQQTESPLEQVENSAETATARYHTVVDGETLYGIALQYDTTIDTLVQLNYLNVDAPLYVGQELLVSGIPELPVGSQYVENSALLALPDLPTVPKYHFIQAGETVSSIAEQYGNTVDALLIANQLQADSVIQVGGRLLIPGAVGQLIATTATVGLGENLTQLAAVYNTDPVRLLAEGDLVSPLQLLAGQRVRVISRTGRIEPQTTTGIPHVVQAGETLTTLAAQYRLRPSELATANALTYPTYLTAGQRLRIPIKTDAVWAHLPNDLSLIATNQQPFVQGEALGLFVTKTIDVPLQARLIQDDPFVAKTDRFQTTAALVPYEQAGIQGRVGILALDAFAPTGHYRLQLETQGMMVFDQKVLVEAGGYGIQNIFISDAIAPLLAPEVRAGEDAQLLPIYQASVDEPLWDVTQPLRAPLEDIYITAPYGDARSYNGGPYEIFHTGVDFSAPIETPVGAAAAGRIVFSDETQLRGNLVIIDHGLGVMTAYFHLTQRLVTLDETVTRGQVIGSLGSTGLVSGPHLHWDVRVRGVPVDGIQWLQTPFP